MFRHDNLFSNCLVFLLISIIKSKHTFSYALENDKTIDSRLYKLKQVQIVHRHGDRTPITPMKDEEFWSKSLPDPFLLKKIAEGTNILRDQNVDSSHGAKGRGVFGKLTNLGLLQMVEVGSRIREELHSVESHHVDGVNDLDQIRLFHPDAPLHPDKIKVYSTDFPRTLQSVQALLVGLFPDGLPSFVDIDARHTNILIPDPQPRSTKEQVDLERQLSKRPHLTQREEEMRDLAIRVSNILRDGHLGKNSEKVSFGVGEDEDGSGTSIAAQIPPLSWSQLSEITTCLRVRDKLPAGITHDDHEAITSHSAWRWFENLRHPQLSKLAMRTIVGKILRTLVSAATDYTSDKEDSSEMLYIYSAHDSSLIGLLCAFRLDQPAKWPEYGSYLKIELIQEVLEGAADPNENTNYYVRFSLNGETLKCHWGVGQLSYIEPADLIPLEVLSNSILSDHNEE